MITVSCQGIYHSFLSEIWLLLPGQVAKCTLRVRSLSRYIGFAHSNVNGLASSSLFTFEIFFFKRRALIKREKDEKFPRILILMDVPKTIQLNEHRGQGEVTSQQKAFKGEAGGGCGHERGWGRLGGHKPVRRNLASRRKTQGSKKLKKSGIPNSVEKPPVWQSVTVRCFELRWSTCTEKSVHMHCCVPVVFNFLFYWFMVLFF